MKGRLGWTANRLVTQANLFISTRASCAVGVKESIYLEIAGSDVSIS